MGKKGKIGKQRRDKYYKLAKEAGYRSRAAFKLIQLNKRFEFLQNARATVDLCAAPGGWMQVAVQNMPVSSLVIGVDLAPIKPIKNAIALQGDITKEDTRQAIKKELQNWSADCVLHDGAPNVGLNWIHDAFQQNCLVLSALKLATQILRKGGTFVTKVFRSADYACLIAVFEKLFKKVHVWKPAASRLESAEIFVVCERYEKPLKVDPALLDVKRVFENKEGAAKEKKLNPEAILVGKQRKAKAEGYDEGQLAVHQKIQATDFIQSHEYLEMLASASEIVLDKEKYKNAEESNEEVLEYMRDLKVCGPRELRILLRWRKAMRAKDEAERKAAEGDKREEEKPLSPDEIEDKELAEIDELIAKAAEEEKAALKKKKKRMLKAKALLLKRKQLKMIIEGDKPDPVEDIELFSLKRIRRARELATINKEGVAAPNFALNEEEGSGEDEEGLGDGEWETREKEADDGSGSDSENELIHTEQSHLNKQQKKDVRTEKWFEKDEIAGLISDEDEEAELNAIERHLSRKGEANGEKYANTVTFDESDRKTLSKKERQQKEAEEFEGTRGLKGKGKTTGEKAAEQEEEGSSDGEESEEDEEMDTKFNREMDLEADDGVIEEEDDHGRAAKRKQENVKIGEDGKPIAKKRRLTPEELAIGEQLIHSAKAARELEEFATNRYTNNDEGLPDWFVEDEKRHYRKIPQVTKEQVQMYRERMRELNARPSKKVAEAKARKQRRMQLKLAKAKKKAEGILENEQMEHAEKIREMKKIYAKAAKKEQRKPELVVMTKGKAGKLGKRPKGRYKLVDSRMKKDLRAQKAKEKTKGRGGKGKKVGGKKGRR